MTQRTPCVCQQHLLTFLQVALPLVTPVGQLLGIGLFNFGPLSEASDQIVAQPVAILDAFYRAAVVASLDENKEGSISLCHITVYPVILHKGCNMAKEWSAYP